MPQKNSAAFSRMDTRGRSVKNLPTPRTLIIPGTAPIGIASRFRAALDCEGLVASNRCPQVWLTPGIRMKRLTTFIFGMLIGALLYHGALHYHLLRSSQGFHVVPKITPRLGGAYVDARSFGPAEWAQRPDLVAALLKNGQGQLMEDSSVRALHEGLENLLQPPPSQ